MTIRMLALLIVAYAAFCVCMTCKADRITDGEEQ
jgi:hypothetical protein